MYIYARVYTLIIRVCALRIIHSHIDLLNTSDTNFDSIFEIHHDL